MMRILAGLAAATLSTSVAAAQTAYYNTDRGRPVQIEDAYATERYAFEMKLAPVRLERAGGGLYTWGVEPELAYGVLPRTQLEIGLPVSFSDIGGGRTRVGIAGLEASLMHNLNVETRSLPALGLRADILAPVGSASLGETYASFTGLATRTLSWARFHLNGQYTLGKAPAQTTLLAADVSRWLGGVAVDRTFPLRAMLITLETYARGPMQSGDDVEYTVGSGVRYQWSPMLAVDAGLGRRFTGDNPAWFITFGSAYSFGIASLIPGMGR